MQPAAAREVLEKLGFKVYAFNLTSAITGLVIAKQTPEAGNQKLGSTITLAYGLPADIPRRCPKQSEWGYRALSDVRYMSGRLQIFC